MASWACSSTAMTIIETETETAMRETAETAWTAMEMDIEMGMETETTETAETAIVMEMGIETGMEIEITVHV